MIIRTGGSLGTPSGLKFSIAKTRASRLLRKQIDDALRPCMPTLKPGQTVMLSKINLSDMAVCSCSRREHELIVIYSKLNFCDTSC